MCENKQNSKKYFVFTIESKPFYNNADIYVIQDYIDLIEILLDKDGLANAIKSNVDNFKTGLVQLLSTKAMVTILRISNPQVRNENLSSLKQLIPIELKIIYRSSSTPIMT